MEGRDRAFLWPILGLLLSLPRHHFQDLVRRAPEVVERLRHHRPRPSTAE